MVVMCGRHILYCLAGSGISLGFLWRILDGKQYASTSWTTNSVPSIKWDSNWDRRESINLEKSPQKRDSGEVNQYNEQHEKAKPKASRHLILIRHGQSTTVSKDCDAKLTQLGREQASITGKRLKDLNFPYTRIVQSSMQRALETSQLIHVHIPGVKVETCSLLQEGAPIPPEPPIDHWRPKPENFYQDGARIEAAFRKYFHRALPNQESDTYDILVCHANVIRYFLCRALQFPPEAWLRFTLHNCSITWIVIRPNGRVIACSIGDIGHINSDKMTSS